MQDPLPKVLNPGDEWIGTIPQYRHDFGMDLEKLSQTGHVIIAVGQSHCKKELKKRLFIKKTRE
jgi:hypothetical protein